MNISTVRKFPHVFCIDSRNFRYDYYGDPENRRRIYLELNIICEAQYLISYELREGIDGFVLAIHKEATKAGATEGKPSEDFEFAGLTSAEATKFMIREISKMPNGNGEDGMGIAMLERNIRAFFYLNKQRAKIKGGSNEGTG